MKNLSKKVIAAFISGAVSFSAFADNFTIGTGSQSGTYYPLGGTLAKIWGETIPDFNMRAEVTAGSVENSIKVATNKQLAGIAMGSVVQKAHDGKKPFPMKMDVAVVSALYPNVVHFMVPAASDIKSISDLKGKKVSLGAPGSGTRTSAIGILGALGMSEDDLKAQSLNYTATTSALANGQIDAGVIVGSLGVGAVTELTLTRDIRVLSFSADELAKISEAMPSFQALEVPANSYNNVPAFNTPAVWNVLVVNKNADTELVYNMTKSMFENIDQVRQSIKVTSYTTVDNMQMLGGVPLHAGAQKYLDEVK
ncbi:TAXI family TRAP transporter solute-binding subunit [Vibrio gallaecicus]|uniref:TAXI family TRAP transporter solute-binding subunit n=1 Tax=Vibrio gallaecicus TaxID=552386 RepID=UPI0010C96690|nr:TAXI family TRAP transporter solute-binding subunit [Vibrio gallaecicus]MDN3615971.1 TAXI family TRAP transporter solute-binding subunit [Vibrio gallaecicus]